MNRRQFLKTTALVPVAVKSPTTIYASTRGPDDDLRPLVHLSPEVALPTEFQVFTQQQITKQISDCLGLPYNLIAEWCRDAWY